jgi:hypothetical protein
MQVSRGDADGIWDLKFGIWDFWIWFDIRTSAFVISWLTAKKAKGCKRLHSVTSGRGVRIGTEGHEEREGGEEARPLRTSGLIRHSVFGFRHFPGLALVS